MPPALVFLLSLLIDGALAGAIYALIALMFVVVYKSSRIVNFALGEWIMAGALLAAAGQHAAGLGLGGAILLACLGMAAFGVAFNALVAQRLLAGPVISLITVTIGLGALLRGGAPLVFAGVPRAPELPPPMAPLVVHGVPIPSEKLIAALSAALIIALAAWFYRKSRTGIGLRAIADDPEAAAAAGIDPRRLYALLWGATGIISVAAGILWAFAAGGGFGVALVGLKIFPIVIIGGLDSLCGTIIAAMLIGVIESLGAGYVDPLVGGGFGNIASYLLMMAMLMVRPYGLFGRAPAVRV